MCCAGSEKKTTEGTINCRLARVLFNYRITPQSTTGTSPAQLLMGRLLRTRLDLLKPDLLVRVGKQQERMKDRRDLKEGFPLILPYLYATMGQGTIGSQAR